MIGARSRCRCRCCSASMRCNTGCATAVPFARSSMPPRSTGVLRRARAIARRWLSVIAVGSAGGQGDVDWLDGAGARKANACDPVDTAADDPAILIYTSGTTGRRRARWWRTAALIGNLSRIRLQPELVSARGCAGPLPSSHVPRGWAAASGGPGGRYSDAVFWSPADWAWTGGLMDALLPTLYFGRDDRRLPGALRSGSRRLRAAAALSRDAHAFCSHRAEGDDEGGTCAARAATRCACARS